MFRPTADSRPLLTSPLTAVYTSVRSHWIVTHLLRIVLASLMITLFTISLWSLMVRPLAADAASPQPLALASHPQPPRRGVRPASIAACPKLPQNQTPPVSSNPAAISGLGDMGAFTFFTQRLNDRMQLKVNVVNGNLVLETSQLHIQGTGIDLDIGAVFNGLPSADNVDMGAKWNLTVGTGIFLSVNSQTQAVTLHTSTGSLVTYFPDSKSQSGYDEPPNMDATLLHNQDGSYTLVYQHSGECFGFTTNGQETYDEDKNTNVISFAYSGSELTTITDTQNRVTTIAYDSNGRIKQITDPMNRIVTYLYQDGNNNLTDIVDAAGKTTHFVYNGHDLTSITDPLTNTTALTYKTGDLVGSEQDAFLDPATTFDYEPVNAPECQAITTLPCTVVTDPNSGETTYYASGFQVKYVFDQLQHQQQHTYTPDANVTTYTDGAGDVSTFNFDPTNNTLTSLVDGNNAKTSFLYGDSNNPYSMTQSTDPQGNTALYGYDQSGNRNLLSAKDTTPNGTGATLSYSYYADDGSSGNGRGTLHTITDADNNVTTFYYDAYGNLQKEVPQSPLAQQTFVEDPVSRVSSVTDGNGVTINFTYDKLDRITLITYTQGTKSASITYGYDDNGNLTSLVDNTGTTSYKYDADNRLTKKTLPNGVIFTSKYDVNSNLKTLNDGGTDTLGTTTYGYDAANRMTSLLAPGDTKATAYGYDPANRRTSISYPNNTGMQIGYDPAGHETSNTGGVLNGTGGFSTIYSSYQYVYKMQSGSYSNLLQSVKMLDPLTWNSTKSYYTRNYVYDTMSRLTQVSVLNSSQVMVEQWSYGYDKAGNRTSSFVYSTGESATYTYPSANELTKKVDGGTTTSYTYDGNGNLTSASPGTTLAYNIKNQTKSNGSNSYTYSGATQADQVQENSTTFNYSGLGISSQSSSSGKTYYIRCSCGLLNSERTPDGKTHYFLFDALDSVVGLTDSTTGNDDNMYDYDPYGQMKAQQEGETNNFKYVSGYFDTNTNLYHFGARYYDPSLGRWTQQDPVAGSLGDLGSADRYAYANDDPVNKVDPSGKFSTTSFLGSCIEGVVGVVITAVIGLAFGIVTIPAGLTAGAFLLVTGAIGCVAGEAVYLVTQAFGG
jgi:RHS repeat-associated protein